METQPRQHVIAIIYRGLKVGTNCIHFSRFFYFFSSLRANCELFAQTNYPKRCKVDKHSV